MPLWVALLLLGLQLLAAEESAPPLVPCRPLRIRDGPNIRWNPNGTCYHDPQNWDRTKYPRDPHKFPYYTSFSPLGGPVWGGSAVQLTGVRLSNISHCRFGNHQVKAKVLDDGHVRCISPRRLQKPQHKDGHWDPMILYERVVISDNEEDWFANPSGSSSFKYYWYNVTAVYPRAAHNNGGAAVEIMGWAFDNFDDNKMNMKCKFGDRVTDVVGLARMGKYGFKAVCMTPKVPFKKKDRDPFVVAEVKFSLNGVDFIGGETQEDKEPYLFTFFPYVNHTNDRAEYRREKEKLRLPPTPLQPVVLMHDMGADADSLTDLQTFIQKTLPGVQYLLNVEIGNGAQDSVRLDMNTQVKEFCRILREDRRLVDNFTLIGVGQGALIGRGYIERCNTPRVYNYVSLSGPQAGVSAIPWDPNQAQVLEELLGFSPEKVLEDPLDYEVQARVSFAGYWRFRMNRNEYTKRSTFLADINNESPNATQATRAAHWKRLTSLNAMVLIGSSTSETLLKPPETQFFGFYDHRDSTYLANPQGGDQKKIALKDTTEYMQDWLGLLELDRTNRLYIVDGDEEYTRECMVGRGECHRWLRRVLIPIINVTATNYVLNAYNPDERPEDQDEATRPMSKRPPPVKNGADTAPIVPPDFSSAKF